MTQTLMLTQGYEPLKIIPWQRAITLLFLNKIEVIESYNKDIKSTSIVIKMPAVVRLLSAFKRRKKPVRFSRVNIYGRDKYSCQYCSKKISMSNGTYDHVVPRAQGGKTEWTNIVTCCEPCNSKKGGRTPAQARMKLRKKPIRPAWVPITLINVSKESAPDAWASYIYWTSALS